MSPAPPGARYALASIALVVLAGALRLPGLSRPAWLDETHSLTRAADPTLVQMTLYSLADGHPPLYFAALRGWWAAFGPSDAAARLLSLVLALGSLAVLLVMLGRRSPPSSLAAGLLFATNPLLVRYGTEIRGYGLLVLLALVATAATWRLAEMPSSRPARAALLVALPSAVLTHVAGVFLLPALLAFVTVAAPRDERRRAILAMAPSGAAATAIFIALAAGFEALGRLRHDWWLPATTAGVVARCFGSLFGLPGRLAEGLSPDFAVGVVILASSAALIVVSRERTAIALLAGAGTFWASIVLTSLFVFPIALDRVLLPALPLYFGAIALAAFARPFPKRWAAGAAGAAVLAISAYWVRDVRASFGRPLEDFRGAAFRIGNGYRTGDAILVFPGFAAKALQRYLPEEAARAVRIAEPGSADAAAPALNLVVRPGLDFRRSAKTLSRVLDSIASRAPRPRIRMLLIEPIEGPLPSESAGYRNDAVAAARRAFGEPDEESTNGLLYDAYWRAEPVRR